MNPNKEDPMSRIADRVRVVVREEEVLCESCNTITAEVVRWSDSEGAFIADRCPFCGKRIMDPLPGEVEREWERKRIEP